MEANDTRLPLEEPNSKPQDKYRVWCLPKDGSEEPCELTSYLG